MNRTDSSEEERSPVKGRVGISKFSLSAKTTTMYTYDEWGKLVLHIQTGKEGMKLLQEAGVKNMPREEYDKHMASHRKLKEAENKRVEVMLKNLLEFLQTPK